jgi:predicted metal-dependent hydrolase
MIMETDDKVQYTLKRRAGQRRIYLRIQGDGSLLVTAGYGPKVEYIDSIVQKKRDWYHSFTSQQKVCHDYLEGDQFLLLGKKLVLNIAINAPCSNAQVLGNVLLLSIRSRTAETKLKKQLISDEFSRHLSNFLSLRISDWSRRMKIEPSPHFHLNNAVRQWASCSSKRELSFSRRVACLDTDLVDYLIVHELCHIFHMNHGPEFKALLQTVIPDWKERRTRMSRCYLDSFL